MISAQRGTPGSLVRPRQRLAALALALGLVAACNGETGLLLEVQGPSGQSSIDVGVVSLEYVAARPSWCERWVRDAETSGTRVDVSGRDLEASPHTLLVKPVQRTDLAEQVHWIAVARNANDQVVGLADFGLHAFRLHEVLKHQERLTPSRSVGRFLSADGCLCMPGRPWIGTGSGAGCDLRVPPSFDRLVDTAGCELPAGAPLPSPVCDGQTYPGEPEGRDLPCFAKKTVDGLASCRVGLRGCLDSAGVAFTESCGPEVDAPALPSAAVCDAYAACEQEACGDLHACLRQALTTTAGAAQVECFVRVDPKVAQGIHPCAFDGKWRAQIAITDGASSCGAAVLEGVAQPPFRLGLAVEGVTEARAISELCPVTLQIDQIDGASPAEAPETHELDLILGDRLAHVSLHLERSCADGPSMVCKVRP